MFVFSVYIQGQEVTFRSADDAVAFALQNSTIHVLQRQSALENIRAARFDFKNFIPVFDFSLSETDSISVLSGDSRTKSFQASIGQTIFNGGRNLLAYEMQRTNAIHNFNEYEVNLRNFKLQVFLQYYQYLLQKKIVEINEELVNYAQSQLLIIEREVELGLTLETDYLEYLISFIRIENERNQSIRDFVSLERNFKNLLNMGERATFQVIDDILETYDYCFYEPYLYVLWPLINNHSLELKRHDITIQFSRRQLDHSRRWYLPSLAVNGGVTFSGVSYPLTEPRFSLRITLSFQNNPLFPVNTSSAYGFNQQGLNSVSNNAEIGIRPDPVYYIHQNLSDISIMQAQAERIRAENDLRESFFNMIESHDNKLRDAYIAQRMVALLERRLEFTRIELETGDKKHIDYLRELVDLSQIKISFYQNHIEAFVIERNAEILANIPFGGLKDVCLSLKM
jgi:outer membrane protein TolC